VLFAVAACAGGTPVPPTSGEPPTSGPPAATATLGTPAGPIPASAFFVPPPITSSDQVLPAPVTNFVALWPLCGARYASDAQRTDHRGRHIFYYNPGAGGENIPEETVDHTISLYQSGAGPAAMQQIRAALQACPHDRRDGSVVDYTLLTAPSLGDEAMLIQETWNPQPGTKWIPVTSLATVVRVGDVVTVLLFVGWEGLNASPAVANDYTTRAVTAIEAWLR
jgi:hypothetical protein